MADEKDCHNTEEHHGQAYLLPLAPDHQDDSNWNGGKYQPGESCPFLGGFPDLHVDEDVEDGQEGEGEYVHEDKVQPSHVYLIKGRNMKSSCQPKCLFHNISLLFKNICIIMPFFYCIRLVMDKFIYCIV